MKIGFSTGSLALADVRRGVQMALQSYADAIELSALREEELKPLIDALDEIDVSRFSYVSLHAPSRLQRLSEQQVVDLLQKAANRGWSIVVHPDVISTFSIWETLEDKLCLENMDKRKTVGRTASELRNYFHQLPLAKFCFDIGHARQIDPTMLEAWQMLREFGDRLGLVHMSYVNSSSRHEPLNFESKLAFQRVVQMIAQDIPIILETPVRDGMLDREMQIAESVFNGHNCYEEAVLWDSRELRGVSPIGV